MPFHTYAYRIGRDAALLNEDEWDQIAPLLDARIVKIQKYREQTGVSIAEARQYEPYGQEAMKRYFELTGIELEHPEELYGLKKSEYGSLCPGCSKPFRTPRAKICACCGYRLRSGQVAGTLGDEA
ncbi:hypothetical protein [Thalassococcus lentus]|uniref:HTH cro/C1-type domain-containing protein n=1 Tax=Thalassococcus lentus TaxID=1210524 RepID=A0ABT4XVZ3_9RHOB|nr:hypothetical protein [Thalassococcus lentus]MDA7426116.1 hypothetical protein [Thalassococcus lentus]